MKKKLLEVWADYGRKAGLFSLGLIVFGAITLPRLGSLTPGNSIYETPAYLNILHKADILHDISFAPMKTAQFVMLKIDSPNSTLLRLVSAAVVFVAALAFYLLINKWHTRRVAIMATLLFVCSSYTLHLARLANVEAMYLCVIPIMLLMGTWMRSKKHVRKLPLAVLLTSLLLYIPGVWLLVVLALIAYRKRLYVAWKFVGRKSQILGAVFATVTLLPLIYSLSTNISQLKMWLGIADNPGSITVYKDSFLAFFDQLFLRGINQPHAWLYGTAVLDVFIIAMAVLGIYGYRRGHHPLRARLLVGVSVVSVFLFMLGGQVTLALVLPIVYILAAAGMARMLQNWFTVFPRNPFARNLGVFVLSFAVGVTCFYHLKRYYVAWPNAPQTKQAFRSDTPK